MTRFHATRCFYSLMVMSSMLLVTPAHAQVCREAAGSAVANVPSANVTCDMNYRDTTVTCDKVGTATTTGTRPPCPAKPMPMLTTPKKSLIGQFGVNGYSPYLFAYPRDPNDKTKPYSGGYYRGTPGDMSQTFQMSGNTAGSGDLGGTSNSITRLAACVNQIKPTTVPSSAAEEAKLVRLQLDNCTNQYILNASLYPFQKENSKLLSMEDPTQPSKRTELSTECQPLRTFADTQNEYSASTYLKGAWIKLLQNPGYRMNPVSISLPPMVSKFTGAALGVSPGFEPQLPIGLNSLSNPIAPPDPFPEVTLGQIGSVPYEEIVDPSHPFSPRWNYVVQDRTYSPITSGYMSPSENAVFCAGVREDKNETDPDKKAEKEIQVDVLEFRRPNFEEGLFNRVAFNYLCQTNGGAFPEGTNNLLPVIAANSWCFTPYWPWPGPPMAIAHDCQTCFGTSFPTDDESTHPPCTTNYMGKDLSIKGYWPGLRNGFNRTASCTATGLYRDKKYNMDKLCRDIRKPYTQLNKVKMRYHNPDDENDPDKNNVVLRKGVMEGMTFKEYFGNHMPYPRLWDTGLSLQKQSAKDGNDQPPMDTTGQWTAIVGVGRESAAGDPDNEEVKKHADERCMLGGWGGVLPAVTIPGGMTVTLPDPVTSWTEMKLYQTRSLRQTGMSCLARYEKVFKDGSSEAMALKRAGGEWSKAIIAICPKNQACTAENSEYKTQKEFKDMGGQSGVPSDKHAIVTVMPDSWPLAWRGYMFDPNTDNAFPKFAGDSGLSLIGLDNAKIGDLVMMPYGGTNNLLAPGLPKVGFVSEVNLPGNSNCASTKNCYVKVEEADNGKSPDVCGTTDNWGEMKTRYLYKPGHLPDAAKKEYERLGYTKSCEDTKISQCELVNWDLLQLYRVGTDERDGCDKDKSDECADGATP